MFVTVGCRQAHRRHLASNRDGGHSRRSPLTLTRTHDAYTEVVDKVRLGRALGYGTRHMAKTIAAVAEAATAPQSLSPPATPGYASASQPVSKPIPKPASGPAAEATPPRSALEGRVVSNHAAAQHLGGRARHLKHSLWQPLAVFSGALWLRVTGVFFALLASTMGAAAWRQRSDLRTAAGFAGAHHFWLCGCFTTLFGYFAVSSFIRANLRERRALSRR